MQNQSTYGWNPTKTNERTWSQLNIVQGDQAEIRSWGINSQMSWKFSGDGPLHGKEHSISFPLFYFIMHIIGVVIFHYPRTENTLYSCWVVSIKGWLRFHAMLEKCKLKPTICQPQNWVEYKSTKQQWVDFNLSHEPLTVLSFLHDYHKYHFDAVWVICSDMPYFSVWT